MVDEWREWDVEEKELPLTEEETLSQKEA